MARRFKFKQQSFLGDIENFVVHPIDTTENVFKKS